MKTFRQALVLGLGASGESAARLLAGEGTRVTVVDQSDTEDVRAKASRLDARVLLGVTDLPADPFDVCVVSPGVPADSEWIAELSRRDVPVIPEFEFGWSRHAGRTLAVTGTNGKSTIVKWITESLNASGISAVACGNYGLPVSTAVAEDARLQWLVIEVSSFQAETAREFRPDVGILLNLLPNHLDRHVTMDAYASAKARMFLNMRAADIAVVHAPHAALVRARAGGAARWVAFGDAPPAEYTYAGENVLNAGRVVARLGGTYFGNDVLGCNAAGAAAALVECGVSSPDIEASARAFQPLPHRMQAVHEIDGVRFVNDSKATTLSAMDAAMRMCGGRVRLIAGGLLKESDLNPVKKTLAEKASGIYLIGRASKAMHEAWSGIVPCVECDTLECAVDVAWRDAGAGETVLLSPGCASFDQFRSYAERGELFGRLAQEQTRRPDHGKK